MALTLEALEVLDAIDRKGSFAAAARELERVPSALTYTVRKLEEELDVLLFDRRGHRAKLTPAGRELLEQGRVLLASADELTRRVKGIEAGWEAELRIALDEIVPFAHCIALLRRFYELGAPTRLRINHEVLSGCWDALLDGRADVAIGAPGEFPAATGPSGGIASRAIGAMGFVFAVSPAHPLAAEAEPLATRTVARHRAVAIADTARRLPARSVGLSLGQEVLTVPSAAAKLSAQIAGLGVGYLPVCLAAEALQNGRLIAKEVEQPRPSMALHVAWRTAARGKAAKWFVEETQKPEVAAELLGAAG